MQDATPRAGAIIADRQIKRGGLFMACRMASMAGKSQNNGQEIPWRLLFAETSWCRRNRGVNWLDSQACL